MGPTDSFDLTETLWVIGCRDAVKVGVRFTPGADIAEEHLDVRAP
jgi:hypothetical protein